MPSGPSGLLYRKPWPRSQPIDDSRRAWSRVSMPLPVAVRPRTCAISSSASGNTTSSGVPAASATNDRVELDPADRQPADVLEGGAGAEVLQHQVDTHIPQLDGGLQVLAASRAQLQGQGDR